MPEPPNTPPTKGSKAQKRKRLLIIGAAGVVLLVLIMRARSQAAGAQGKPSDQQAQADLQNAVDQAVQQQAANDQALYGSSMPYSGYGGGANGLPLNSGSSPDNFGRDLAGLALFLKALGIGPQQGGDHSHHGHHGGGGGHHGHHGGGGGDHHQQNPPPAGGHPHHKPHIPKTGMRNPAAHHGRHQPRQTIRR